MSTEFHASLTAATPPDGLTAPMAALWWLKKGDLELGAEWELAHNICQSAEGQKEHDWVHALAHLIEKDIGNANYWYHRCGETRSSDNLAEEWAHIVGQLDGR